MRLNAHHFLSHVSIPFMKMLVVHQRIGTEHHFLQTYSCVLSALMKAYFHCMDFDELPKLESTFESRQWMGDEQELVRAGTCTATCNIWSLWSARRSFCCIAAARCSSSTRFLCASVVQTPFTTKRRADALLFGHSLCVPVGKVCSPSFSGEHL